MERTPITFNTDGLPSELLPLVKDAKIYDSSCSQAAKVVYIDRDGGYFLKTSSRGELSKEARLTRYFYAKGLAPEVVSYVSDHRDWLVTARAPGEDCTAAGYLDEPERLAQLLGETLRRLHETDCAGCPVPDRTEDYYAAAERCYRGRRYYDAMFPHNRGNTSSEEVWHTVVEGRKMLKSDVLIHGDFCLPNVILNDWRLGGFIDLGNGGVGDRHIDLYWGLWSLNYNLKSDRYGERFLDAYGRDKVDTQILKVVGAFEMFG